MAESTTKYHQSSQLVQSRSYNNVSNLAKEKCYYKVSAKIQSGVQKIRKAHEVDEKQHVKDKKWEH